MEYTKIDNNNLEVKNIKIWTVSKELLLADKAELETQLADINMKLEILNK